MGRIILSLIVICLLIIPLASADIFRQNTEITFIHLIRVDGGTSNSILANITITAPDESVIVGNDAMTYNDVNKTFSYTLDKTKTSKIGDYSRCITATNNVLNETRCYSFTINQIGSEFTTAQSIAYFLILIILIAFFILCLYGAVVIPFINERNELSEIIQINHRKYLKLFAGGLAYMTLIWIIYISWNLSYGFLQLDALGKMFRYLFSLLVGMAFPIFAVTVIIGLVVYFKDKKIQQYMDRGIIREW